MLHFQNLVLDFLDKNFLQNVCCIFYNWNCLLRQRLISFCLVSASLEKRKNNMSSFHLSWELQPNTAHDNARSLFNIKRVNFSSKKCPVEKFMLLCFPVRLTEMSEINHSCLYYHSIITLAYWPVGLQKERLWRDNPHPPQMSLLFPLFTLTPPIKKHTRLFPQVSTQSSL